MMPLLIALAAAAAAPQPGALKTFRDWTVGCDNVRACHATSLMPEDGAWEDMLGMSVRRDGASGARPVITILGTGSGAARLSVAGKALPVRLIREQEESRVDPRDHAVLLAALRSASAIAVEDRTGGKLVNVSLAGASAALLYIDEQQQRVGTVTALVRPGTKPASAVPMTPPIPVVRSTADSAKGRIRLDDARLAALRKQAECIADDPEFPGYGAEQEPLDADHTLILLGCGAGAYNYSSIPYVATRRGRAVQVEVARFDHDSTWRDGPLPMLVNAAWDPKEELLTSFSKGRGIADCGVGSDYAWDGERFRLVEQIEMGECRGSLDYITTWRVRVER